MSTHILRGNFVYTNLLTSVEVISIFNLSPKVLLARVDSRINMRAVLTLALLYVSFSTGQNSLYRSPCKRIGNFSVLVKGKDVCTVKHNDIQGNVSPFFCIWPFFFLLK